jgi:galactokinase
MLLQLAFAVALFIGLPFAVVFLTLQNSFQLTAAGLAERFRRSYGADARIFRAPGRVNLIGEHTDYNDGFVMPAALEFSTWVAASERADRVLWAHSDQFNEDVELSLDVLAGPPKKQWSDFIRGVAAVLQASGYRLSGANLLIEGQVPIGAGLSSSASIEVAIALALLAISQADCPPLDLVKMCQRAEHEYVGTRCGIMDQFVAVFGRAEHALMLDCRSLRYEPLAIPPGVRLVICNSMVKHDLAAGEYNLRRADCETGIRILRQYLPGISALRDVSLDDLEKNKNELPQLVYRRCRHVISENERVLAAAESLKSGDLNQFGKLMYESHRSLRDDYEVSCHELDLLVEIASTCEGVYGSRMTGGGFGGCTISLVRADAANRFQAKIRDEYASQTKILADIYVCSAAQGASSWPES